MVRHELSLAKTTTETVERRMALTLAEKDAVAKELQHELEKLQAASSDGVGGGQMPGNRNSGISCKCLLVYSGFQGTIEQLTSQRVMLQQQCVELREDNRILREAVDSGGLDSLIDDIDDSGDLESGSAAYSSSDHSAKLMRGVAMATVAVVLMRFANEAGEDAGLSDRRVSHRYRNFAHYSPRIVR